MRVRVDREADAVYVNLTDRAIKDSAEVAEGIVVDYDDEGRIVGVEILDASKRTEDPTALTQFNLDLPKPVRVTQCSALRPKRAWSGPANPGINVGRRFGRSGSIS
jgi:uncharacterized protein YuzE